MNTDRDEVRFLFKFNIQKIMGLPIEDDDLVRIAAVLDADPDWISEFDAEFKSNVTRLADDIRSELTGEVKKLEESGKKIICIGDSLTSDRESYQCILHEIFQPAGNVSFIDAAVSGNTTKDLRDRFYLSIMNNEFDTALIFIGINDSRMLHDGSYLPLTGLTDFENNMKYMIKILRERVSAIYVVTLPYVDVERLRDFFSDRNFFYTESHVDCMNGLIRNIAEETECRLIDFAAVLKSEDNVLEPDGIHLNAHAHRILAKMVLSALS